MIRKMSKHAAIVGAALALSIASALAQTPSYEKPPAQFGTYSASFSALAIPQSAAMDAVCLVGSASKLVKVLRVAISGTDSTAQTAIVNLVKRTAANTGGTSTSANIAQLDSLNASATAVLKGYTAASTPGAGVAIRSAALGLNAATGASAQALTFDFNVQMLQQPLTLRGAAQQACVNIPNALTTAGAALNVDVTWTEQ